jgi:hypothetical protein
VGSIIAAAFCAVSSHREGDTARYHERSRVPTTMSHALHELLRTDTGVDARIYLPPEVTIDAFGH